jgi:hypothetical protein
MAIYLTNIDLFSAPKYLLLFSSFVAFEGKALTMKPFSVDGKEASLCNAKIISCSTFYHLATLQLVMSISSKSSPPPPLL